METAVFSLENYTFEKILLDLQDLHVGETISLSFHPTGVYSPKRGVYELCFLCDASVDSKQTPIVSVLCKAAFKFKDIVSFEEIPSYFFSNSIAILFPYIRAMVSTVTLQANIPPIVLPTMNLTSLCQQLQNNTIVE